MILFSSAYPAPAGDCARLLSTHHWPSGERPRSNANRCRKVPSRAPHRDTAQKFRIAEYERRRNRTRLQQLLRSVQIGNDHVQQARALNQPDFERMPLPGRHQQRQHVEPPLPRGFALGALRDVRHVVFVQHPRGRFRGMQTSFAAHCRVRPSMNERQCGRNVPSAPASRRKHPTAVDIPHTIGSYASIVGRVDQLNSSAGRACAGTLGERPTAVPDATQRCDRTGRNAKGGGSPPRCRSPGNAQSCVLRDARRDTCNPPLRDRVQRSYTSNTSGASTSIVGCRLDGRLPRAKAHTADILAVHAGRAHRHSDSRCTQRRIAPLV